MKRRSSTARRVVILLIVLLLLAGGLAGAYMLRKWQRNQRALAQRATGVQAFERGQYVDAMRDLYDYLKRYTDDVEALEMLAKARLEVVAPENSHIPQAIRVLRRILSIEPRNQEARRKLLELYPLTNLNTEARSLADSVLKDDRENLNALRTKAIALTRLREFDAAREAVRKYLRIDPANLEMQMLLFDVDFEVEENAANLKKWAAELRQQHPDDPRWELLQAYAHRHARERKEVVDWLRTAAGRTPPNEEFALLLVRLLDDVQLHSDALAILEKVADTGGSADLQKELAWRLWEQNRWEDLLKRVGGRDAKSQDTDLLAVRAMALFQRQRQAEGREVVDALAAREEAPKALAWAAVLGAVHVDQAESPARVLEVCRAALEKDPKNPYFEYVLGSAYALMGEPDVAAIHWQRAAEQRPVWVMPYVRLAEFQLESGQPDAALRTARIAITVAPSNVQASVVWALARAANLGTSQAGAETQLLKLVDAILSAAPGQERLIPLRIALLAKTDKREDAVKALEAALAQEQPLSQAILLELRATARALKPGLEEACVKRAEELYGVTPELLLARALQLAADGKPKEGQELLEQHGQSGGTDDRIGWRLTRARYLDATDHPQAKAEWLALVNELPNSARVQRLALRSPAVQSDEVLANRLIEQLRSLSGDQAVTWRLERARWLLRNRESNRDLSKASALLQQLVVDSPRLIEARLLWAGTLERIGSIGRAIEELEMVARDRPDSSAVALELARLYQRRNENDSARKHLDRILSNPSASEQDRLRAVAMLANLGDDALARAVEELERLASGPSAEGPDRQLLLARLYLQQEAKDKLEALVGRLLAAPTADRIRFLALYYAGNNRPEEAGRALALLEKLDLSPGERESVLADYYAKTGDSEQTLEQYRAAVKAAPKEAAMWYRLIIAHVLLGQGDAAVEAATEALGALPDDDDDDDDLRRFREHADVIRLLAAEESVRPVIAALVGRQPELRPVAGEVLQIVADAKRDGETDTELAKISRLADRHRDFLALQNLLASRYLAAGSFDDAARVAVRTRNSFQDAESARLAMMALARAGRAREALEAAQQWQRRTATRQIEADVAIAGFRSRLGDTQEALQVLRPYIRDALNDPDQNYQVLVQLARILIEGGRVDQAAQILTPLLERSPQWRQVWVILAVNAIENPETGAQWLRTLGSKIPDQAAGESLLLAQAWFTLSRPSSKPEDRIPEFRKAAGPFLEQALQDPAVAPNAWLLRGQIAEQDGNRSQAAECYRAALKGNPELDPALNNLAMVLADTDANLKEALSLAEKVVALQPQVADYLDTLAQVQARMGDYDKAIANLRKAANDLQPNEEKWWSRLEDILRKAGRADEADRIQRERESRFGSGSGA